ncbi:MAG: DUF2254 family protein [Polyangiaceae bacterium]|nr:DUF2254 family protein [Polyangiaceae bacterium]
MSALRPNFRRQWLIPVVALISTALVLFSAFYSLDDYLVPAPNSLGAWERYTSFDPTALTDAVSSLAGMIAAVLGIVITVVSIIVQLSADRYQGVTRMFLRDRVNVSTMAFYVVACVCGVWLSVSLKHDYVPRSALLFMLAATTLGLVIMAPYFAYVFWFLDPMNIIYRIRHDALQAAIAGTQAEKLGRLARAQASVLSGMEELTDITSSSVSNKDKIIASGAVDALKDLALAYLEHKPKASSDWFRIGPEIRSNPDFVAMDPESLTDLENRRTWVEWKVMRQYLGIYNEALGSMRDINYLVAIDTRYLGEAAARNDDRELVALVFRFLNSYLRATLNARDVRTAYNVLNQYRLLVESMIRLGRVASAVEGVRHMIYYGHVSFDMKLTFVTETVAYDISTLCQLAHDLGSDTEAETLRLFLELDRPLRNRSQEAALLGVRKAQVKLAAYYLLRGHEENARTIFEDMREEPADRLHTIRATLSAVESKDFWEIIDRGRNFEYMPVEQRDKLGVFFAWFNDEPTSA